MNVPRRVCDAFGLRAPRITPMTEGHINESWRVRTAQRDVVVQRINGLVFPNAPVMVANADRAARALRRRWPGFAPEFIETRQGELWFRDVDACCWRAAHHIAHAQAPTDGGSTEDAYRAAEAFGRVLRGLEKLALEAWENPIPGFHELLPRLAHLDSLVAANAMDRNRQVANELELVERQRNHVAWPADLPPRLIHGDCKLSNVLFDAGGEVMAVVDLDTVMVGFCGWDFGDLVRSAASSAAEDEPDPQRITLDMAVFEALAAGYLKATGDLLTGPEVESLALGAPYITFMLGVRFLADFLDGDRYFRIRRERQNLHRARAQLKLASVMLDRMDDMKDALNRARHVVPGTTSSS